MSRWSGVLFLLMCLVFLSCGGSNAPAGFTYSTDWSHRTTAGQITGVSQKVNILDSAGLPISTIILQNITAPVESTTFTLPDGKYVLQVQLYSSANAAGVQTGIFEYPVTISGGHANTVQSSVGDAIDSIGISPIEQSVQVGRGAQFHAFGVSTLGVKTFIAPSSLTWSVLGGVGTVTDNGNFTATAIGSGTVRATYTNGKIGSALVTGTPPVSTHSKWTVMVFLNSANSLQSESFKNMNQMERVADNPDVRFVVQWKQFPAQNSGGTFNGTRRYLIKPDTTSSIASEMIQDMGTSVDMGSPQTVHEFVTWAKANYPADHYCLILWDHGSGWQRGSGQARPMAISQDDEKGTVMEVWDFNQALGSEHFDIIACDACDMQMLEVGYELKDNCDYFACSEEVTPAPGYPYDLVFGPLRDNPDLTPLAFSKSFVDGMLAVPSYAGFKITQSVVDTSKLPALATAISSLGTELKNNSVALTSAIQTTRTTAQGYDLSATRYYRDIFDVCLKLEANTSIPSVLTATAGVKTAVTNAVVWEGHNSLSPNSHGISIDFSSGSAFASQASDYQLMKLAQSTQWDEFLTVAP